MTPEYFVIDHGRVVFRARSLTRAAAFREGYGSGRIVSAVRGHRSQLVRRKRAITSPSRLVERPSAGG